MQAPHLPSYSEEDDAARSIPPTKETLCLTRVMNPTQGDSWGYNRVGQRLSFQLPLLHFTLIKTHLKVRLVPHSSSLLFEANKPSLPKQLRQHLLMRAGQPIKDPGSELLYLGLLNSEVCVGNQKVIKTHHLKIHICIMSPATAFCTQNESGPHGWGQLSEQ